MGEVQQRIPLTRDKWILVNGTTWVLITERIGWWIVDLPMNGATTNSTVP